VSEFNLTDIVEFGLPRERLSVLHMPAALFDRERPARRRTRSADDPVELMFLGRFVRAKGVYDLLDAVSGLIDGGHRGFHVTVAGNSVLSDPEVLETVRRACQDEKLRRVLSVAENPSDDELRAMYENADAFVMPSHHEGFGVPVTEALSAGCYVIAYDSGNLPHVLGGLGTLVPTGDVGTLASAMREHVERVRGSRILGGDLMLPTASGLIGEDEWRAAVSAHMERYSYAGYRRAFLDLLRRTTVALPGGTPDWLTDLSL
jgi:glycosyltransferase involved in cell wall biosynthesis